MQVRYTRQAQHDLDGIFISLDKRAPSAAQAVKDTIERRIAVLANFPFLGPETEEMGIRELTIVQYPYKVYYEIDGDEIWILHVRDSRRRPWKHERSR